MTYDPWPITWPCDTPPSTTQAKLDQATGIARQLLWARTGMRLGLGTITEDYHVQVRGECAVPFLGRDGLWDQGVPGGMVPIVLLQQPVHDITSVTVDGATLSTADWRLEGARLYRTDGQAWPVSTVDGDARVRVTYRFGVELDTDDDLGRLVAAAMGEVATEVHAALCGAKCKLPSRAVSVTRQGVTVNMVDPTQAGEADLLGLPIADLLIQTVNPGRRRARSRVYSPDMPRVSPVT